MSRDIRLYTADIIVSCDRITEYVDGHPFATFCEDYIDAVARDLEIIGEAVKNVPTQILGALPEIVCPDIAKFRDVIAHRYFPVKLTVVWDLIHGELEDIRKASHIFGSLSESEEG
jgi:uncharacterized protein with HEPN domain